ncbi:unnamed protein product, partial [Mesorhabditis belari]|uniref:sphinganine-1-phosphate aldolase n=1 Tax=Mesorhabditis belari TaxID=2138241 RepID=A0AAF3EAJ4_9BILA
MQVLSLPQSVVTAYECVEEFLGERDPVVVAAFAFLGGYTLSRLWSLHTDDLGLRIHAKRSIFYYMRKLPFVKRQIEQHLKDARGNLEKSIHGNDNSGQFLSHLPQKGLSVDETVTLIKEYSAMESTNWMEGRCSGAVFHIDESESDEMRIYREVCDHFAWSNPLWPKLFPGVRKMEAEIVRISANLLGGNEKTCGTMSTGGTASILLACLAHRNRALKRGIQFPEMVIPESAHAAFIKAGELFRIKVTRIPVDPDNYRVNVAKMRKAISDRTCMLVGSAVNFPSGAHDDIESIGKLGQKYNIPVHVDACLGGFLLPFIDDARPFDFRVPGVCSISADTHKYGLTPKGSSVILYSSKEYLHNQYFCDPDWQGGIYASSTLEGSRAGLNIALCWASLRHHGAEGYRETSRAVVNATRKLRDAISAIPGLKVMGACDVCVVGWTGEDGININRFHALMEQRNWGLTSLQFPAGVHLMVTMLHTQEGVIDALVKDAREVVDEIRRSPNAELTGAAALYGMAQKIPDRSIVHEFAFEYLDTCYTEPPRHN